MRSDNKALKVLRRILSEPRNIGELVHETLNPLIDDLNNALRKLSFGGNFDSYVIHGIVVPAGGRSINYHRMGVRPSYRLIMRQKGGGAITDGEFTKDYIELKNDGATDATLAVILFKE